MLTEYHGKAVAGGTYPALIWKTFMEQALEHIARPAESFPPPPYPYSSSGGSLRDGKLHAGQRQLQDVVVDRLLQRRGPVADAPCKPTRSTCPGSWAQTNAAAQGAARDQPLTPRFIYKPARPGQRARPRAGAVPARRDALSWDKVTLVLAKPLHGNVPKVVGISSSGRARSSSAASSECRHRQGAAGRLAAAARGGCGLAGDARHARSSRRGPGARPAADELRAGEHVAPGPVGRFRDPDPRAADDLGASSRRTELERRRGRARGRRARAVTPSAWQSRPGPEQRSRGVVDAARARASRRARQSARARGSALRSRRPPRSQTKLRHQWMP